MLDRLDGTMTKMMTMKDKDDDKEQKENSIMGVETTPAKKQQKEVTNDMNTESSKARKEVPVRRLSRSSSAKLTSSFRGGSLKNVMEDAEVDDSSLIEVVLTELRPTRRLSRGNSAKSLGKKSGSKRRIAQVAGMSSLDDSNNKLLPARRLSRGNSARNGSFRGSLRNVMEDKEADMASLDDDNEENVEVPGERRRSYPPGNRTNSFRSNSLRSMRLYNNSTSSLSSCASSSEFDKDRNSIDINNFGVEHRYYHERPRTRT